MIKYIRELTGIQQGDAKAEQKLLAMEAQEPEKFNAAWQHLMGFYRITAPVQYEWFANNEYEGSRAEHLGYCIRKNVYMAAPPNNDRMWPDIAMDLEEHYPSTYGPVTFEDEEGNVHTTKEPVRIGSMCMLLLEKIADDWSAVSSGPLQIFGVLTQISSSDKYASPTRKNAIRTWGEAEIRIMISYAGSKITAETLDRNNNPLTHEHILYKILEADYPTNIDQVVDRSVVPLGGAKPLQYVKHLLQCAGVEFTFKPYVSSWANHQPQMGTWGEQPKMINVSEGVAA